MRKKGARTLCARRGGAAAETRRHAPVELAAERMARTRCHPPLPATGIVAAGGDGFRRVPTRCRFASRRRPGPWIVALRRPARDGRRGMPPGPPAEIARRRPEGARAGPGGGQPPHPRDISGKMRTARGARTSSSCPKYPRRRLRRQGPGAATWSTAVALRRPARGPSAPVEGASTGPWGVVGSPRARRPPRPHAGGCGTQRSRRCRGSGPGAQDHRPRFPRSAGLRARRRPASSAGRWEARLASWRPAARAAPLREAGRGGLDPATSRGTDRGRPSPRVRLRRPPGAPRRAARGPRRAPGPRTPPRTCAARPPSPRCARPRRAPDPRA